MFAFSFLFHLKGVPGKEKCHWKSKFLAIRKQNQTPPKIQRIQQVSRPCCSEMQEGRSQERQPGLPESRVHFASSPVSQGCIGSSCAQSRLSDLDQGDRKARETLMFLDSAGTEALKPGLRKLGESPVPKGRVQGGRGPGPSPGSVTAKLGTECVSAVLPPGSCSTCVWK